MTSRLAMVHVHDPRVRWSMAASQVVRIVSATEWDPTPAIDVLAALGPAPSMGTHVRRVVVVRGAGDRETALYASGKIDVSDVEPTDVLPLPDTLTALAPEIAAIVVAQDASLSLLLEPSAVTPPTTSALHEEPCSSRS
jgi:chemotaxis signal transduction protein